MARKDLIEFRRDTAANWTSVDPVLAAGEPGFETDTGKVKIGDGASAWSALAYISAGGSGTSPLTTKGDLWGFDTADDRVPVGLDGDVLTADSGAALGVSWQPPPASGGDVLHTVASSGSSQTADYGIADVWDVTLTADCTFSLTGFTSGDPDFLTLILRQDGTGSRTVTWPTITWLGSGIPPILQTAAGSVDSVVLFSFDGGTTVYGIAQTSASGLRSGTSFPGSPSDGDLFYRTDSRVMYEYVSAVSKWLSLDRKYLTPDMGDAIENSSSAGGLRRCPVFEDIYIERWVTSTFISTTNNGSNFWTLTLNKRPTTSTPATVLGSFSTNSDTVNNYAKHDVSLGVVIDHTSFVVLTVDVSKTGTPGGIRLPTLFVVRAVG